MSIPGSTVHQQLMQTYASIQRQLEDERERISAIQVDQDGLASKRSDALRDLAEYYFRELSDRAIGTTWDEVRPRLSSVLLRKEGHRVRVEEELESENENRSNLEARLLDLDERIDSVSEKRTWVATQVEEELQRDTEFTDLADRAAMAEAAIERAEANLSEIEQDAVKKLPAYEQSTLFCYLRDRHYGTDRYTHRGFTRRMDRTIAKMVDFNKAFQSYTFLKNTPDQMRKILAEDRQAFDTVMEKLERQRDRIAEKHGLPTLIHEANELLDVREKELQQLDQVQSDVDQLETELIAIEDPKGSYYREAIQIFRDFLARFSTDQLHNRAEDTAEIDDDHIVARLVGIDLESESLSEDIIKKRRRILEIQEYMSALGKLIQQFRAAQFESSRSNFLSSFDVIEELDRAFEEGTTKKLWKRIRNAQRWGPRGLDSLTAIAHPMSSVLVNAMESAVDDLMGSHARRAGDRRAKRYEYGGDSSDD